MIFNRNAYNALLTCDHGSSNSCHKVLFVYFKQKTAYEMRISDWISDVCSSDLLACFQLARLGGFQLPLDFAPFLHQRGRRLSLTPYDAWRRAHAMHHAGAGNMARRGIGDIDTLTIDRSEEHTSELQSLMRISYAVFCLKKKTYVLYTINTQN